MVLNVRICIFPSSVRFFRARLRVVIRRAIFPPNFRRVECEYFSDEKECYVSQT